MYRYEHTDTSAAFQDLPHAIHPLSWGSMKSHSHNCPCSSVNICHLPFLLGWFPFTTIDLLMIYVYQVYLEVL